MSVIDVLATEPTNAERILSVPTRADSLTLTTHTHRYGLTGRLREFTDIARACPNRRRGAFR